MIEKVRSIWITGYLQHSLFNELRVLLGLSEKPDAVDSPLSLLVRRLDKSERPPRPGIPVDDFIDGKSKSLLIWESQAPGRRRCC
jgi:hypothetical protein